MDGFDIVVWYLLSVYLLVSVFIAFIVADDLGWISKCSPKEDNENIEGEKEESDDYLELCIWN